MNYAKHYDLLMDKAKHRGSPVGYFERHHIVPRCLGGSNKKENIARLTAEEHYVAHQLLAKIHHGSAALVAAATMMAPRCGGARAFGWLRRQHAEFSRKINTNGKNRIGKRHSQETKDKISRAKLGVPAKAFSEAHKANIALSKIGIPRSAETKKKLSIAGSGKQLSESAKSKLSAFFKGGHLSLSHRQKISDAKTGVQVSVETKEKLRAAWVLRKARLACQVQAKDC
jgi:hypothetical protein